MLDGGQHGRHEQPKGRRVGVPRCLGGRLKGAMGLRPHRGPCAGFAGPVRQGDGDGEVGVGGQQVPQRVAGGEGRAEAAEGGHQPVEGAEADADEAVAADHVDGGAEGGGGGVPDGVEEDVVDGVEGPVAVAGGEEAAREGGPEVGGGQP